MTRAELTIMHCVERSVSYSKSMLGKLLGGSEFGQWASFATPAFFDVMPTKALLGRLGTLVSAARDRELFARAIAERRRWLERSQLAIELVAPERRPIRGEPGAEASVAVGNRERANAVVALYFHQLLHGELTLLDLRQQAFVSEAQQLSWRPAAWIARWDADFGAALRQLYIGFYGGDDAGFRAGLGALNLLHAEPVFRQHFGDGQGTVRFEVKHFVSTFHRVFLSCKAAGTRLHPDFLPLGLYLASLYDHLERLGVEVDVAAAFELARDLGVASRVSDTRAHA